MVMKNFTHHIAICLAIFFYPIIGFSQVDVLTQHNDLSRTGWNSQETVLNHTNVKSSTFGQVFTLTLDDQVYAQPLVVSGVNIPSSGVKNVAYVCTVSNSVYAFDADKGTAYWNLNFTPSGYRAVNAGDIHPSLCGGGYYDFGNNIGIVSTPVIDKAANTMYFVTKIASNTGIDNHAYNFSLPDDEYNYTTTGFYQYLHAIDLSTGAEKTNSPVQITATYSGTGDGSVSGTITFDPRRQLNRAGLVLSGGIVYLAFAAHCDWNPSHGWLLGYDASTLQQKIVYCTTPNDGRGGIWMSGAAPAVDASGSLYFATGNSNDGGVTNTGVTVFSDLPDAIANRGESVVKVTPNQPDNTATSVTVSSYFTPYDYIIKNENDLDFPIEVMLIPNTHMLLTGNKDDSLYLMDTTNLGGYSPNSNNVLQTVYLNPLSSGDLHTSLAYFAGSTGPFVYQVGENTQLQAFPVGANSLGTAIANSNTTEWPTGSMGGFMSVSSNGSDTSTAILWITQAVNGCNFAPCQGILRAVKANDINTELWNSTGKSADNLGNFGKMSPPTIANGKVFQSNGTNQVVVYSTLSSTLPLDLINFTAVNIDEQYAQLNWTTSGAITFDYFDVEKSSDGITFTELTKVNGETGNNGNQHYAALDNNPVNGVNYYRIKEVDLAGNIYYSSVVTVNFSFGAAPRLSPNPANTYFTVIAGSDPINEITLFDVSGKTIEHIFNDYASSNITVATERLTAGIYIVEIKTASHAYHQKLLKQ